MTALHTVVTLVTEAAIAFAAYEYLGLGMLRRGWINFDWLWCGALTVLDGDAYACTKVGTAH